MQVQSYIDSGHLVLQHEGARLVLDPEHGGAIREYSWMGHEVLRASAQHSGDDPFELASFPLVPYANRIAHGRFAVNGHEVRLRPNRATEMHPLHGQGWRRRWQVVDATASDATLQFEGGGDEWPWRYCAEQHFRLSRERLTIRLSIENLSDSLMPAVLGLHPYFPDAAHARMRVRTARVWTTDAASLPLEEVPTPSSWSFDSERNVAAQPLDNCFGGWDGSAVLRWPGFSVTLRATNCRYLHVYVPAGSDFFCLEPQTAASGALGRQGEAMLVQPGERFAMRMSLDPGVP